MTSGPLIATDDERFRRQRPVSGDSVVLFVFHSCTCLLPVHWSINCIKMLLRNKTTRPFRIERMQSSSVYIKKRQCLPSGKKEKKIEKKKNSKRPQQQHKNNNDTCRLLRSPAAQKFQGNQRPNLKFFRARNFLFCRIFACSTLRGNLRSSENVHPLKINMEGGKENR
jgi:hypothetical protein